MPAATVSRANGAGAQAAQSGPVNPFFQGSWEYSEPMFTDTIQPGAAATDFFHNITPGGFLRGITVSVTSTGGVIGGGSLAADFPWNLFQSISLESIDGTSLMYPMGGYAYMLVQKYFRPWDLDPANDPAFVGTINAAFRLRLFLETYATLGVVPNTDARAQYRLRFTTDALANLVTGGSPTAPAFTINTYLETYAQPDRSDLFGRQNQQVPDGVALQRFNSHEIQTTSSGASTYKSNRVGNAIRSVGLVFRNSSGVRTDLTSDPIRLRVDNTQRLNEYRDRRDYEMDVFYGSTGGEAGSFSSRPTGVYWYPFFLKFGTAPGNSLFNGQSWLLTSEATYLQWEVSGAAASGTLELITDDLAPVGPVPPYMVGS